MLYWNAIQIFEFRTPGKSFRHATGNDGEGRTLTPTPTNSISTFIDYSLGLDDTVDVNLVLSQQLT